MLELFQQVELNMKAGVDHLHHELKGLRTGRASLGMLEGVTVEYYGTPTPLNQLANLAVPEPSLITAQAYDKTQISAIEKAIHTSGLGLNPSNDGNLIRIPIPPLTEERRKEFVKVAHEHAESARNSVRQARREGNDELKKMEREKEISEDDEHRGLDEVQKLHDHYIKEINSTLASKEAAIMEV